MELGFRLLMPAFLAFVLLASARSLGAQVDERPPVAVRASPLATLVIQTEASAPATVVSLGDSRISAEIGAAVTEIPVRVGDVVEAGGILMRLECADYRLAVAELEAMLAGTEARIVFSQSQLERVRSLKAKQTVSEEVFEQRESELAGLTAERNRKQAQLDKARRSVDRCELRAPFRAAVVERIASVGEYAMPGSPLLRVLDVGNLEVSAHLIVGDAAALLHATRMTFRHGGNDYPVTVRALGPQIDPIRRTREVRLTFEHRSALPGATGRLVWSNGSMLPADLLVRRDNRLGVMLAADGRARFHPVPEAREGRPAPVTLPPESLVITDGRFSLRNGDAIRLAN